MNYRTTLSLVFALILLSAFLQAQVLRDPKGALKNKAINRIENRAERSVDQGLDEAEQGAEESIKGGKKEKKNKPNEQNNNTSTSSEGEKGKSSGGASAGGTPKTESFKSYSKFDFVSGEKVIASEDFAQDAIGDFPAKWNTNATAEVVTLSGKSGKWLKIVNAEGSFIPEFITDIPENSTVEFELIYNNWDQKYAYNRKLIVALSKVEKQAISMKDYNVGEGALFTWDGGMGNGSVKLEQLGEGGYNTDLSGNKGMEGIINPSNNGKVFKISLWRQKTRLRIYVDELKVFDMPRIFASNLKLNELRFYTQLTNEDEEVYISNLRVAVGAPDTRNKLITEGKFVTTGITFDVGSANIKPSSYGVLKEIANVLTENPEVKVKIIGHTDSDGDAAKNLDLSKKRSESVSKVLNTEFGIDPSRMQTDGKGASEPAQPNTSPAGKANNRRVEFLKL